MENEILDLVDEHDQIVGQQTRAALMTQQPKNCRVINAFLVNSQSQLWIPRRTAHKALFPLHLDMSCGGYVRSGETYEEALKREVQEELNLDIRATPWSVLGHLSPYVHGVSSFMTVYEIRSDQTPVWNPDDFVEAAWLKIGELQFQIQHGEPVKDDLLALINRFYL